MNEIQGANNPKRSIFTEESGKPSHTRIHATIYYITFLVFAYFSIKLGSADAKEFAYLCFAGAVGAPLLKKGLEVVFDSWAKKGRPQ